jgi:hypothetical protein
MGKARSAGVHEAAMFFDKTNTSMGVADRQLCSGSSPSSSFLKIRLKDQE